MGNIYRVEVDSGSNGPNSNRVTYIREEDDELLWMLLERIRVNDRAWDQQQARREERRRRERPYFTFHNAPPGSGPTFTAGQSFYEDFIRNEFFPKQPKPKSNKMKLAEMAGVEWSVAELMDNKKLLRKAQQKCHPDTGGSHEEWLKLQKLQSEMGL